MPAGEITPPNARLGREFTGGVDSQAVLTSALDGDFMTDGFVELLSSEQPTERAERPRSATVSGASSLAEWSRRRF